MDPWLSDAIDWHGRRIGAPVELIAILGPGRTHVVVDGLDLGWLTALPADRVALSGQLGGIVIERGEAYVTVTAAFAGGPVHRWCGAPRCLEQSGIGSDATESVGLLWRLLDPDASAPVGSASDVLAEIAGRALLGEVVGQAMQDDDERLVNDGVAAFRDGSLAGLARLAGVPRPPALADGGYVRQVMIMGGHRRVPLPSGRPSADVRNLHRAVPLRWQIAADIADMFGVHDVGKALLACSPTWGGGRC